MFFFTVKHFRCFLCSSLNLLKFELCITLLEEYDILILTFLDLSVVYFNMITPQMFLYHGFGNHLSSHFSWGFQHLADLPHRTSAFPPLPVHSCGQFQHFYPGPLPSLDAQGQRNHCKYYLNIIEFLKCRVDFQKFTLWISQHQQHLKLNLPLMELSPFTNPLLALLALTQLALLVT